MTKNLDLSIVIPAYNEEHNISPLYSKLKSVLDRLKKSYEIIFIDDGSNDLTFNLLEKIHSKDKKVKVIRFQRNFEKADALSAGFEESKGKHIITMDADLQDDPEEITKFLRKINEGYDLVVGWRYNRKDPLTKKIPSKIFNLLVKTFTKIKLHDSDCNFRAMSSRFIKELNIYSGLYRFIPSIAISKGFSVTEIKVVHHKRKNDKSKYGFSRLFKGFFDLITLKFLMTYNKRPLHFFGGLGTIFSSVGFIIAIYLSFIRIFFNEKIGNRPLLLLAVLLIFLGIQFISIGLIGEMITSSSKDKNYIIKTKLK